MSPRLPLSGEPTKPIPSGIRCPDCGKKTRVIRRLKGNGVYRRRRECLDKQGCGWRFWCTEKPDEGQ